MEISIQSQDKNNNQKLQELVESLGLLLNIAFKILFVVAVVSKIVMDIIFRDCESQGFMITLILSLRLLDRLRFIDLNMGIATNTLLRSMGDTTPILPQGQSDLRRDSFMHGGKFFEYNTPSITFFAMPFVSTIYPIFFLIKFVLRIVAKLGLKKRTQG